MKAIVFRRYGSPDVLEVADLERPEPEDEQVLVQVRAASLNPFDWHRMRGEPYVLRQGEGIRKPKNIGLGVDVAGVVESVGRSVTRFKPGDEVFGMSARTLAEYARVAEAGIALKPANLSFAQAAAVPVAATTALQGLRDKGAITAGQRVLVVGASGGVGTFAVQLAKAFGAHVSGVTSTGNVELVRSLGAEHVFDYKREDFTSAPERFDLIFDAVGDRSLADLGRVLEPRGVVVLAGGGTSRKLGPLGRILSARRRSKPEGRRFVFFMSHREQTDLLVLKEHLESGRIRPVVDRTFPLSEAAAAMRYLEAGHARGKVVVTV